MSSRVKELVIIEAIKARDHGQVAIPRSKTSYEASNGSRQMNTWGVVSYMLHLVNVIPVNHPSMCQLTSPEKGGSDKLSKF